MTRFYVETDPPDPAPPGFRTDPAPLLALLSFGVAEPFGSMHPLTVLVRRLRWAHHLDVSPLLTFYDRHAETAEDRVNLEAAWQDAAPLRDCAASVQRTLGGDAEAPRLLAGFESIPDLLADLGACAGRAVERGARIRLSFALD